MHDLKTIIRINEDAAARAALNERILKKYHDDGSYTPEELKGIEKALARGAAGLPGGRCASK